MVKKLICPQVRSTDGQYGSSVAPANTTADSGDHCAWSPVTSTVTVAPAPGSAAMTVTGRSSIADTPRASMAHIAYTVGPPSHDTRIAVGVGENW